jgi:hypothetical protein
VDRRARQPVRYPGRGCPTRLCRAVTGDGDVRRRLYTDGDFAVFSFRRCIVITGIDLGTINGDLADRMLPVHLDVIPEESRREESDMWPGWRDAHPRILGAVLDLAASVARVFPSVRPTSKPRMADFGRILACVDAVLGTKGFDGYRAKQGALATESLTGDPFIVAIAALAENTFKGTSAQLLAAARPADERWRPPKDWPGNARVATQRLRRQAPPMRKAGWLIEEDGGANHRNAVVWTITAPEMVGDSTSRDSQGSHETSSASDASHASEPYGPSQGDCPDCREPFDSIGHQINCEGLDAP